MDRTWIIYHPESFVDQGGPCGHSDPFTGADDCCCRDGYEVPAYFESACTANYCDGFTQYPPF